jgi:hypothetical protein
MLNPPAHDISAIRVKNAVLAAGCPNAADDHLADYHGRALQMGESC